MCIIESVVSLPLVHRAPQRGQRTGLLLRKADEGGPSSLGDADVLWRAVGTRREVVFYELGKILCM